MFKSHMVEQPLDRSALRIVAAYTDFPIAIGMRVPVAAYYLAKCSPPCLRSAASLPDQAGDMKLEVRDSHPPA